MRHSVNNCLLYLRNSFSSELTGSQSTIIPLSSAIYEPVRRDAYWTLSLYKVEGDRLKEEPEIDLLATVDEYKKGYIASYIGPVYSYKGNDLLALYIRPLENHEREFSSCHFDK